MESLQQVLVWVLVAVLGAGGLYFVKWMMGHASKAGAERLVRFGLLPVPGMPHPAWAQSVLGPAVRAHLLQIPLVFLVQAKKKVIFPLYFDPWRLCRAFGVKITDAWGLMDHTDVFLDAAILLAEQIRALRPAAPE